MFSVSLEGSRRELQTTHWASTGGTDRKMTKRIMCFGDSNTWGYIPGDGRRFDENVRWTGLIQKSLGDEYRIIEEGMSGRTSVYDVMWAPVRNGSDQLYACLLSQKPLDLVVLMIGTNDLNFTSASGAADGIRRLLAIIHHANVKSGERTPVFPNGERILLVSPIHVSQCVKAMDVPDRIKGMADKSLNFAAEYEKIAKSYHIDFLDAAQYAKPDEVDGLHLSDKGHAALAKALDEKIRDIFSQSCPREPSLPD